MAKLDRLGWAAGICFVAYGRRIGVRANVPEVLGQLAHRLPPGWQPASSPIVDRLYSILVGGAGPQPNMRRFNLLYAGPVRVARTMHLEEALESLESDLQLTVAGAARGRLFVHAGAVGWGGRAIVLPGRTFTGKTTLVAALLRAGATYYSDEYAVFDRRGRVHPYPKALSIRGETGERPRKCLPEALGGLPGVKPLPVGLVAVTDYHPGARWRPRLLSPGQGILELLANTVAARRRPAAALATLQQVVSRSPVLKGARGEAEEMVAAILDKFGSLNECSPAGGTHEEVADGTPRTGKRTGGSRIAGGGVGVRPEAPQGPLPQSNRRPGVAALRRTNGRARDGRAPGEGIEIPSR